LHFRPEYVKALHAKKKISFIRTAMIANYIKNCLSQSPEEGLLLVHQYLWLALGICACLLILNYIDFETSYDDFNVKAPNIFRLTAPLSKMKSVISRL